MFRFILGQLRYRRSRVVTLGSAILVAVLSFSLLTSAALTSSLRVRGDVARNWRSAYQILVRPPESVTALERERGLIRSNYLGGVFGGISNAQWKQILSIPGVEAAAPIANVGYILPSVSVPLTINADLNEDSQQIYRLRLAWSANSGVSSYPDSDLYVYLTRKHEVVPEGHFGPSEVVPGRTEPLAVCDGYNAETAGATPRSPFDRRATSYLACFSSLSPAVADYNFGGGVLKPGEVGSAWTIFFPVLLTAIDPAQESKLLGLDQAVVAGRMLGEGESSSLVPHGTIDWPTVPVIASDSTFVDQSLHVSVERLRVPQDRNVPETLASSAAVSYLSQLRGPDIDERTLTAQDLYDLLLTSKFSPVDGYWTIDPPQYRESDTDQVEALPVLNPPSVWSLPRYDGMFIAPAGNEDSQFRLLHPHFGSNQITGGTLNLASVDVVGQFDPHRLPNFSSLSNLPLETYFPTEAVPADPPSQKALGSAPLLPTMNLGGYVAQPSLMLTTLEAAETFLDPAHYGGPDPSAPISAIRVNVVGATGPDKVSQERIRRVAEAIQEQTGLSVDVTAGSSPHPVHVQLPPGQFGQPPLVLLEGWTQKDTAIVIISAIDRKSMMLFTLILLVSALFIANAGFASVRSRRKEIGILLCMGWSRRVVFASILGEVGLVGTTAGLVGAGLSVLLAHSFALRLPVLASLLAAPAAVLVSVGASLFPAFQASKGTPLDAVRPPLATVPRPTRVRGLSSMALGELRRLPGSTLLGASSLLVGVSALTFLVSVNLAFRGTVVGTLLGGVVSFEVRGVDYLSVGLALLLGGLSVADVLFVNLQERAAEIAALRSMGWGDWELGRFIALQGLGVGVLGTLVGVLIGSALSSAIGGLAPGSAVAGGLAVIGGVSVAVCASVIPAAFMRRELLPAVIAEE